jgi:hypothetical protein
MPSSVQTVRLVGLTALAVLLLVAFSPLFFQIYRTAAFNIVPRDDYGPYLQFILGKGGSLPGSPMIYRPWSVIVAVPFYYGLPFYAFSNLPTIDDAYLRATAALAAVSYLSVIGSAAVMFAICRRKLQASQKASLIVALLSMSLSAYVAQVGIDPLAILVITVLLYLIDRGWPFYLTLVLSTFMNEKIVFFIAIVLGLRLIFGRQWSEVPRLIVCGAAVISYLVVRILVYLPGYENQMMPASFLGTLIGTIPLMLSTKGVVTNLVPIGLVAVLAILAYRGIDRLNLRVQLVQKADVLVFVALLLIGMAIKMEYTIGRLVMFAYPLYLPVLSRWIDDWFPDRATAPVSRRIGTGPA